MKTFLLFAALLLTGAASAQDQDPKAKTVLDEVSKKTKAYTALQVEFTVKTVSKNTKTTNEKGKATMKGNKYHLDLGKNEIRTDGNKKWTFTHGETKECIESKVEDDEEDALNPTKLLTIWEKGYKYRFVKEENGVQEIHLFPIDTKTSKIHTVILKIDKAKDQVNEVTLKYKSGDVTELNVTKYTPNATVDEAKFKAYKKDYPGYTWIVE